MKLQITTPLDVVVDEAEIAAVRAEDGSGGFGILAGHADLLTSLAVSVVSWRRNDGGRRFCAVRRGILSVSGGDTVAIATREAVTGDDLGTLASTVLAHFRADDETERNERVDAVRLHLDAIRQIMIHLRRGPDPAVQAGLR